MKCRTCGSDSPAEARFCSNCGASLADPTGDTTTMIPVAAEDGPRSVELTDQERAAAKTLAAGNALLIVNRGPGDSNRFLIDSDITNVGRHPESDIFLDDITVSRRHAEIRRSATGYTVCDVDSLNGTYLNRERIDEAPLVDGDLLQVGKFKLMFVASDGRETEA